VTEEVPFGLSVTDRHGNPIDDRNKNETHIVSLHVYGPSDDCGFNTNMGYVHDSHVTLNESGKNASLIKLTSKIGNNYISMDRFGSISDKIESILAVSNGVPDSLEGTISNGGILPVSNEIPANGLDKFTINYFLYDVYKNPLQNRSVLISTNLTDELTPQSYRTNSLGQIQITYGPKVSVLTANITAVADGYPGVTNNSYAKFVGSDIAANLYLVVTPQTLASRDCASNTTRQATVVAILSDSVGIPVTTGEDVTFMISGISIAPNNAQPGPSFDSGTEILTKTVTTDNNGIANLTFYPGSFIANSDSATGYCTITARTDTYASNPVTVEWKNFAYLSVAINATPRTVLVNDTIDITIRITGDGYKMVSNPISVVLDLDTNNIMNGAEADDKGGPSRFPYAQNAAKYFVGTLNTSDQVGLVTWGEEDNNEYWLLVQNTSYNHALINSSIDSLSMKNSEVSLRQSIHEAVTNLITNELRPPNEVGAIITLGASSYNPGERPLMVSETWINNGIRVYSISYVSVDCKLKSDGITYTDSKTEDMSLFAREAHGIHFCCTNSSQVIEAMDVIRQNLSEIAGVNTSMNLDFEHVTVNSNTSWSGGDVFDYVVVNDGMTSPNSRTTILWPNSTRTFENQTDDWNDDFNLNFSIGTLKIKQSWETTFRLKVKKEGTIDLFGPGSTISYNDMPGNLRLPLTLIQSVNNTIPLGLSGGTLEVSNLAHGDITNYVPLTWNLQYKGSATATERMWYSFNNGTWVQFGTVAGIPPTIAPDYLPYTHHAYMDITKLPPGYYQIKVQAFAPDSPDSERIIDVGYIGNSGVYIKLE
jgi:hypothetical protein